MGLAAVRPSEVRAATDTVNTCNESTLRSVISSAAAGDTVTFGCSGTITLTSGGGGPITLSKNLTIDGSGQTVTISGGKQRAGVRGQRRRDRHAERPDHQPTAYAGSNSSWRRHLNNGGTLTVTNSTFSGNSAGDGRRHRQRHVAR